MAEDVRWIQLLNSFQRALAQLALFVAPNQKDLWGNAYSLELSPREELGLIKAFEMTYEQAWLTLQDLLEERGFEAPKGPIPTLEKALEVGYIQDADGWLDLHKSRKQSVHTYDQRTAETIIDKIKKKYYGLFVQLEERLKTESSHA